MIAPQDLRARDDFANIKNFVNQKINRNVANETLILIYYSQ